MPRSPTTLGRAVARSAAVLVLLSVLVSLAPPATTAATSAVTLPAAARKAYSPRTTVHTGNPNGTKAQQYAVVTALLRNIDHSPKGSTITLVTYSYALERVTRALTRAHRRGVVIRAVIDAHSLRWRPARELSRLLNTRKRDRSFARFAHGSTRVAGGNVHQKSWLFSRVGRARWVTMVGSTNLTKHCAEKQYSDMLTLVGRRDVYRIFTGVFATQSRMRDVRRPFVQQGFAGGDVAFFPMRHWTPARDPVVQRIERIPARGARIEVSAYSWWNSRGADIARALAAKRRHGARVSAIIGRATSAQVRRILRRGGVRMRAGHFRNGTLVHSKLMIAAFQQPGGRVWQVWTGSDNWANESLGHDEVDLGIRSVALWRQYHRLLASIPNRPVA